MIRRTMEFEDESELSAAAQAVAMARELKKVADAAPDGHVLAVVEMATLEWGRRFTRERFQGAFNAQTAALEQKGARLARPCSGYRRSHGTATRRVVTAAGDVTLRRAHCTCRRCRANAHPLVDHLGVDGLVSPHAQRLLCVAGVGRSFAEAARSLRELAGLNVCDNTVCAVPRLAAREPRRESAIRRGGGGCRVPDRRDLHQHHPRLARGPAGDRRQAAGRSSISTTGTSNGCPRRRPESPRPRSAPARPWARSGGVPRRGWGSSGA